jgi:large subunit ribosomal protein L10
MNRNEKQTLVDSVKQTLQESSLIVVVQQSGLTVSNATDLRRRIRAEGAEFRVVKNTLLRLVVKETSLEGLTSFFKGPTAIAFSKDPIVAAKIIAKYAQENPKLSIVGGCMNGTILDASGIKALATLPSLDELRGKMVALISAPATKLAILLKEPAARVARVISAKGSAE